VFLDATYVKAHDGAHVVSKAIVVATGVAADGNREVLGLAVGDSEDKSFWTGFLRSLRQRGLNGVRRVISDAHEGLRASIEKVMIGSAWQRCRVHFLRNVLARVPKGSAEMVAAASCVGRACQGLLRLEGRTGVGGQGGAPAAERGRTTLTNPRSGAGSWWAGRRRRGGAQRYLGARRNACRRRQQS